MPVYDRLTAFCRSRWVYALFFVLPLAIYYPLFRPGIVLQGGTDLLFGHYPGLLYGHHMVRSGDLGLWNRLIYDGRDYSQSLLNHILYPLNWPTLLVPDRYVLRFISWQLFLEICACGCIAYAIAGRFLADPWARLLVAVTTELGGFMWFNVTTFIGVHLTFVTLIAIYLLLTPERRRYLASFVGLSFCFAGVMLIGHPGYLSAFGLVLVAVFVAKLTTLPSGRERRRYGAAVVAAGVASLALSAFRMVPIFVQLSQQSSFVGSSWFPLYENGGYLLLAGAVPGALGLDVPESFRILGLLGIQGRNNQFHILHYFGIAGLFLGYLGLFAQAGRRALIMALVAFVLVMVAFALAPFSDAFYLVFWPITHESMPKIAAYFAILAMMTATLRAVETGEVALTERRVRPFFLIVALALATFVVLLAGLAYQLHFAGWALGLLVLKLLLVATIALGAGIALRPHASPAFFRRLTGASVVVFAGSGVALAGLAWLHHGFLKQHLVLKTFASDMGAVACAIAVVYAARLAGGREPPSARDRLIFGLAAAIAAIAVVAPPAEKYAVRNALVPALFTAVWSVGVFLVLSCAVVELFARGLDRRLLVCFLAVLAIGDLVFFDRVYEYVNGPPFLTVRQMYPEADPGGDRAAAQQHPAWADVLDTVQYRVSHPTYLVGLGQSLSNIPMVYGIPTYAGEDSDVPADYLTFLQAFDPDERSERWYLRAGIVTEIHSDRLLDLLGVRYDIAASYAAHPVGGITLRPDALARFALFKRFEVIPDRAAAIARLKDPNFDPTTTLVLDREPGWAPAAGDGAARFAPMPFQEARSDLIHLAYDQASPSLLLFDDTYSPLWHAAIDGMAVPLGHGNVNFMAVSLPAGKHELTLSFEPVEFYRLARIGIGAAALLLALALYLALTAGRRAAPGTAKKLDSAA